jgi:hypothetical protein
MQKSYFSSTNVYCSYCNDTVRIVDFTATMEKGDLVLKGKCDNCNHSVVRLIEGQQDSIGTLDYILGYF